MPKIISKTLQQRILRSPGFRRLLADAHRISGVECLFLDELGIERIRMPRESMLPLRQLELRVPIVGRERMRSRQRVLAGDAAPDYPWTELARPLTLHDERIGWWVMSGWRNLEFSDEEGRLLWVSWVRQGVDLSWPGWLSVLKLLPGCDAAARDTWERQMEIWERELMRLLHDETGMLPGSGKLPPAVVRACETIRENFQEPLTLKYVARICGISPEHLSRQFHQSAGLRFREYLAEIRVEWVCRQLEQEQDPIGQLAHQAGFSTLSRFNRTFRQLTGMTPSQWRKRRQNQSSGAVMRSLARSKL